MTLNSDKMSPRFIRQFVEKRRKAVLTQRKWIVKLSIGSREQFTVTRVFKEIADLLKIFLFSPLYSTVTPKKTKMKAEQTI